MDDCLFCKIANKEIPAKIVFEDGTIVIFNDINPQAPTHLLVIPKEHIGSITKVEPTHKDILMEIIKGIKLAADKAGISDTGFRVVVNHGKDSGQAVPHLHFHVLGGRQLLWPPG